MLLSRCLRYACASEAPRTGGPSGVAVLPGPGAPCSPARPSVSNGSGSTSSPGAWSARTRRVRGSVSRGRKPLTVVLLEVSSCWRTDVVFIGRETMGVCAPVCARCARVYTHECVHACTYMYCVCMHSCVHFCVPGVHMCAVCARAWVCVSVCMCTCVC